MNKEEFDLIIPIGASCKPAFYLKENNFRKCAYLFDWNLNSFFGVRRLFENNFEDYFSDYSDVSDSNKHDIGYKVINNNKNNIRCMHYIFDDGDIDSQVKNYAIMMKKRFFRLKSNIENASSVLIVTDFFENVELLMEFLYDFSKKFPNKKIKMVRILSSESIVDKQEFVLSDKLSLVQYRFDDFIGGDWIGNYEKWMEVMSNYTLSI